MIDQIAFGVVVIRVTTDDSVDGVPVEQLWAAALPREEAVAAVKLVVPSKWTAELTDKRLTTEHVRKLSMKLGSVRELSSAG